MNHLQNQHESKAFKDMIFRTIKALTTLTNLSEQREFNIIQVNKNTT